MKNNILIDKFIRKSLLKKSLGLWISNFQNQSI